MSKVPPFAEEPRQSIIHSNVNRSTSKHYWSFSKQDRFKIRKSVCPEVSYQKELSTLQKPKIQFGSSKRRVFTQTSEAPSSWVYNPLSKQQHLASIFGPNREECVANTYYPIKIMAENPGPSYYHSSAGNLNKGYTLRPKTAQHRTYFIDDKQQQEVPSPCNYHIFWEVAGKTALSKFKATALGNAGLQYKNQRFKLSMQRTPSPFMYQPKKYGINKYSKGGKMGKCKRKSFIDDVSSMAFTPGPGKYRAPTEFAHYKGAKQTSD